MSSRGTLDTPPEHGTQPANHPFAEPSSWACLLLPSRPPPGPERAVSRHRTKIGHPQPGRNREFLFLGAPTEGIEGRPLRRWGAERKLIAPLFCTIGTEGLGYASSAGEEKKRMYNAHLQLGSSDMQVEHCVGFMC